jgi:hypothetical protein
MTQHKTYPLPPLLLTEVIDRCRNDHTYQPEPEDEPEYQQRALDDSCDMTPTIVKITEGYGRHDHDEVCRVRALQRQSRCLRHCDDSDWIVELQYHSKGYHAVYGIERHGDVQDVSLWMD